MSVTPTPEEIKYMHDNIADDLTPSIHISSAITMVAATASVILRFFARRRSESGLGKDDYCLFLGYIFYMAYMGSLECNTRWGLGRHAILMTDPRSLAITSILMLYHRIFPSKNFRIALLLLGAVLFAWTMAAWFSSIFNCYPIESSWDPNVTGFCIDYGKVTLVIGIFNIVIDFIMLGYPMPLLWKLQMPTRRKILLSFTFVAGSVQRANFS
ncbi:hypothetical protein MMYC01_202801 [Madurella mycetomatis]|uniref:Rhodopsin domain-containing protein n=1 Tax=Madurella mycetomatis TaxID=100816 RepID=A0A175WD27_9PEZI|nr:hypothetical protein MMYC01_202801 [Madurella mycetomatis]